MFKVAHVSQPRLATERVTSSRLDSTFLDSTLKSSLEVQVKSSLYRNNRQPYGSLSNVLRKPAVEDGSRWRWRGGSIRGDTS